MPLQHVSLELTRRCGKACAFCYNASAPDGGTAWDLTALVGLVEDLARHGVQAVSFGGGEPLEFPEVLPLLERTRGLLTRSLTTNGLHVEALLPDLARVRPERVQVSLHGPADVERVLRTVALLEASGIPAGVNVLVRPGAQTQTREVVRRARACGVQGDRLVLLPMRGAESPHADELGRSVEGRPFLSTTCLTGCARSPRFCSVRWDRTVAWCSYTTARAPLAQPTWEALVRALDQAGHAPCTPGVPLRPGAAPIPLAHPPVAHSMDSDWFAVDEDGHVAEFESGEAGAVPRAFLDPVGVQYAASELYERILRDEGSQVVVDLDPLAAEPDGRCYALPWGRKEGPAQPSSANDISDWDLVLLWLPDAAALTEAPGLCRVRTPRHVFALAAGAQADSVRSLLKRRRALKAWKNFTPDAELLGVFRYEHLDAYENWCSGPYGRRFAPRVPLQVSQLRGEAAALVSHVRLGGLRFARDTQVQPVEQFECSSHQRTFVPAYQDVQLPMPDEASAALPVGRPDVHLFVAATAAALDPHRRPRGPFHATGPLPKVDGVLTVGLGRWALGLLASSTGHQDGQLLSEVAAALDAYLAQPTVRDPPEREPLEELVLEAGAPQGIVRLHRLARGFPSDSALVAAARRAARAVVHAHAGDEARTAEAVLRLLSDSALLFEVGAVTAPGLHDGAGFVHALDVELLRLACRSDFAQRLGGAPPAIQEVLWRCPEAWIARLARGSFGLLVELAGEWRWFEGPRDEVLATVPERWFAAATEVVLGLSRR